jgi:hypothetical protein
MNLQRWTPPEEVTSHSGGPIDPDEAFFAAPVPEIGQVISAASQVKHSKRPFIMAPAVRWLAIGAISFAGGCFGVVVTLAQSTSQEYRDMGPGFTAGMAAAFFVIYAIVVLAIGVAVTSRKRYMTIIGSEGVIRAAYPPSASGLRMGEVIPYRTLEELRTVVRGEFRKGDRIGTRFRFHWRDYRRRSIIKLMGRISSNTSVQRNVDEYAFGTALERAWLKHMRGRTEYYWLHGEPVRFNLSGSSSIALWPDEIEISTATKKERFPVQEIRNVVYEDGALSFQRVQGEDSESPGRVKKYNYPPLALGNAGLLHLLLVERTRDYAAAAL